MEIDANSHFIIALEEIAHKGILKKVNLRFHREVSASLRKLLEALKDYQLTSFSQVFYQNKARSQFHF